MTEVVIQDEAKLDLLWIELEGAEVHENLLKWWQPPRWNTDSRGRGSFPGCKLGEPIWEKGKEG